MWDQESVRQPERLSSKQVKQILERAVAIDSSAAECLSLDDLREVADEAGISQAALAAALREVRDAGHLGVGLNSTSERWGETVSAAPRGRIPFLLRGRVSTLSAGAIAVSVLIVFMWLLPGILQHVGQ